MQSNAHILNGDDIFVQSLLDIKSSEWLCHDFQFSNLSTAVAVYQSMSFTSGSLSMALTTYQAF